MRCFNHPDRDAIGSCKTCCKGLCMECASDMGHGLACKNVHEQQVESLNALFLRGARIQGAVGKSKYVAPAFNIFMGLVFAGYGMTTPAGITNMLTILGLGFLVFGVLIFVTNRKAYAKNATNG